MGLSSPLLSSPTMLPTLIILILLLFFSNNSESHSFKKLKLPIGNEAYAFDSHNGGPYTGLNDGRIVKYAGPASGFLDFATTSPNRSKEVCDGKMGPLCGRPLGLGFNHKTGELYIIDAFRGLMLVGSSGGAASRLAGGKDGVPFDALDQGRRQKKMLKVSSGDTSGRLLKYNPTTRRRSVVLMGLAVPIGVAVSADGSFVLVAEYIACQIRRFWVKGPKAKIWDIFVQLPGNPDNIKRTTRGDFWVAVNIQKLYP